MSFIKCYCGGRLTRDPEVAYTNNGLAVCRFGLAIDKPKKQGQNKAETDFFNFVAFGKSGELIGNSFQKGDFILISDCRPQTSSYTNKTGASVTTINFIVNSFEFLNGKNTKVNNQPAPSHNESFDDVPF